MRKLIPTILAIILLLSNIVTCFAGNFVLSQTVIPGYTNTIAVHNVAKQPGHYACTLSSKYKLFKLQVVNNGNNCFVCLGGGTQCFFAMDVTPSALLLLSNTGIRYKNVFDLNCVLVEEKEKEEEKQQAEPLLMTRAIQPAEIVAAPQEKTEKISIVSGLEVLPQRTVQITKNFDVAGAYHCRLETSYKKHNFTIEKDGKSIISSYGDAFSYEFALPIAVGDLDKEHVLFFENTGVRYRNYFSLTCNRTYFSTEIQQPKEKRITELEQNKPVVLKKETVPSTSNHGKISEFLVENNELYIVLDNQTKIKLPPGNIINFPDGFYEDLTKLDNGSLIITLQANEEYKVEFVANNPVLTRLKVIGKHNANGAKMPNSKILIPYRLEKTKRPADAPKGAMYDHIVIRGITTHPTAALRPDSEALKFKLLQEYDRGRVYEQTELDDLDAGLLLIPGFAKQTEDSYPGHYHDRMEFEKELIRKAKNRGMPILGICAGSWQVWREMGKYYSYNTTARTWELRNSLSVMLVSDHVARRMPILLSEQQGVGHNAMIHDVAISSNSILAGAMSLRKQMPEQQANFSLAVNSVHWKAPIRRENSVFDIVGSSTTTKNATKRNGDVMEPDHNVVEAYESKYGAPILGIGWHPEAFYNNPTYEQYSHNQLQIIRYMASAGNTYKQKRALLQELQSLARDKRTY